MLEIRWRRWALLILLLSGALLPVALGGREVLAILASLPVSSFFFLFFIMLILSAINSVRLRILFWDAHSRISPLAFFRLYLATEFASKITPGGSGALPAALALLRRYDVQPAQSISIFVVSAGLDILVLSVFLFIVVVISGIALGSITSQVGIVICFCVVITLAISTVPSFRAIAWARLQLLEVATAKKGAPLRWLAVIIRGLGVFFQNLHLLGLGRATAAMLVSIAYWFLHLSVLYFVVVEMGGRIPWSDAMLVQFAAMGLGHLSLSPGGAGVVEVTVITGLSPWMPVSMAAAAVLVWRLFMQYFYIVAGACALLAERMVIIHRGA